MLFFIILLVHENLITKHDFVHAFLALPKLIRNSLIHRLIFVMWHVSPLWTCEECAIGNITMLISTLAIKPCRPESIKSSIYAALKLLLASIINYCNPQQKTNKTPVPVLGSLNRSSDRFMRTGVKAPLLSWQSFSLNAVPVSVHYFIVQPSHHVSCKTQGRP